MSVELLHGDCTKLLEFIPSNSVDSGVTDPPYHLTSIVKRFGSPTAAPAKVGATGAYARASAGFMGQQWDGGDVAFRPETWAELLRVLKPGGHLIAFGGSRTYHRLACAIEDAGFEIRDQVMWLYGSGFPKSHSLDGEWDGWGTALKPAHEPIVLARKPLTDTVAGNVARWGTGAINVDASRVQMSDSDAAYIGERIGGFNRTRSIGGNGAYRGGETMDRAAAYDASKGRWPANVIHDGSDEVLAAFPDAPGQIADASTNSDARKTQNTYGVMRRGRGAEPSADSDNEGAVGFKMKPGTRRLDSGSAARFFYCAKAGKRDREEGLEQSENRVLARSAQAQAEAKRGNVVEVEAGAFNKARIRKNNHPTVKPVDLMRYLCRLVTPPGGLVLDPFMGSGSTGKAARLEGFRFIGIEQNADYLNIARARIALVDRKDVFK